MEHLRKRISGRANIMYQGPEACKNLKSSKTQQKDSVAEYKE